MINKFTLGVLMLVWLAYVAFMAHYYGQTFSLFS